MSVVPPTDEELHAFIDGQLDPPRVAELKAFLESSPEIAARVAAWRRDGETLRTALAALEMLPANPSLDPAAIRRRMRARSMRRLSLAAALVMALGLGGASGWYARGGYLARAVQPMEDAVDAYRVFATDRLRPVELHANEIGDLQSWLSARLGRPMALPDLGSYGFRLLGGRLLSTSEGPAALILYEDANGQRISFYLRSSTRFAPGTSGRRDAPGGLRARYWYRDGYGFAVVGRSGDPRTAEIQDIFPAAL
jgi:anti-sigma factor RsiW